jgi:molybdenum cofactor biosynthesis enzyme
MRPAAGLTHLDAAGRARMVDVAAKPITERVAVASCEVRLAPSTAALLLDGRCRRETRFRWSGSPVSRPPSAPTS